MDIVILDGVRTPMADYNGAFSDVSAIELGAHASREVLARTGVEPGEIDHVIFGNALQTSGDAIYGARHVGLKAGVPVEVPAVTVNRLCGSGFESIVQAAHRILLGEAKTVLAGGMENMSQAPFVIRGARKGLRLGQGALEDSLMVALLDTQCGLYMAQTSDRVAAKYGVTREEQDAYALSSQQRAAAAWAACRLSEEVAPLEVKAGRKTVRVEKDDHLRPDTTLEGLAALAPSFGKGGQVTAGNASGIVDGAAAVVVTSADNARAKGRKPLGRLVSWAVVGVEPELMGIGPAPAARAAIARAGLRQDQIDLWEINEAFAGQILGVIRELGLDREKLNVNGGAIALGHPLGATGTRCTLTLLKEMRRRGVQYGVAGACIGGGQGIAVVLESGP
jgi:acetyl-CoA acetyltransferase family protein